MKDHTPQLPNKVDDVLQRIEKRERSERRKRFILILAIVALIGASVIGYRIIDAPGTQLRTYAVTDLNYEQVRSLLAGDPSPILVTHPDIGTDTIRSADDYVNLRSILELIEGSRQPAMFVNDQSSEADDSEEATEETVTGDLATYILDVEGTREAGKELVFTIENYSSEVTYLLDFGNGYRRRVGRRTTYTYPSDGRFRLRLMATSVDRGTSVYTKPFQVDPGSAPAQVAADNSPAEKPAANEAAVAEAEAVSETADSVNQPEAGLRRPSLIEPPASMLADNSEDLLLNPAPVNVPTVRAAPAASAKPLLTSEIAPEFPGGSRGMARYFRRNYRYPSSAQENSVEGVVYIRFVVNADGSLSNYKLLKGIGYGCDEEALRLIRNMPDWTPGENGGQKVPVYKTIPITFKLIR
jgi:TonB family protein